MAQSMQLGDDLQTRCPHCDSRFRLQREQLDIAQGKVCCGLCHKTFNALLSVENYQGEKITQLPLTAIDETYKYPYSMPEIRAESDNPSLHEAMYGIQSGNQSRRMFAYGIGILMLVGILAIQTIYYQRYDLISNARFQDPVLNLCALLPCNERHFHDLDRFSMLDRNIFTHPTRKNALIVSGSFRNDAGFGQPAPGVLITLSDGRGHIIANRLFRPSEYLSNNDDRFIKSGQKVSFRLEIEDPGRLAKAYEFEFKRI